MLLHNCFEFEKMIIFLLFMRLRLHTASFRSLTSLPQEQRLNNQLRHQGNQFRCHVRKEVGIHFFRCFCTIRYGSWYHMLWVFVPYVMGLCTIRYGSLYHMLWVFVPYVMGLCTICYGSLYHTLWVFVPYVTGFCTICYGSLYHTLWVFVPYVMGLCTISYL